MQQINTESRLAKLIAGSPAVLVLYGGEACGVCQALKPRLADMAETEFPQLVAVWVDCQGAAGAMCAAKGIFALPVVELWFDGQPFDRFVRAFSLGQVRRAIERPYRLIFPVND